jgi:hypothetical protein
MVEVPLALLTLLCTFVLLMEPIVYTPLRGEGRTKNGFMHRPKVVFWILPPVHSLLLPTWYVKGVTPIRYVGPSDLWCDDWALRLVKPAGVRTRNLAVLVVMVFNPDLRGQLLLIP